MCSTSSNNSSGGYTRHHDFPDCTYNPKSAALEAGKAGGVEKTNKKTLSLNPTETAVDDPIMPCYTKVMQHV